MSRKITRETLREGPECSRCDSTGWVCENHTHLKRVGRLTCFEAGLLRARDQRAHPMAALHGDDWKGEGIASEAIEVENGDRVPKVHKSLLNMILHEKPEIKERNEEIGAQQLDDPLTAEAVRLLDFARVAQWVRRARMLVMQKDGKLGSNGLALRRHGLLEEVILYVLRQVAPYPNNGIA